jgi:hypothetical protein
MRNGEALKLWANYVDQLSGAADGNARSEDRQQYVQHLAAAALIGTKLVTGDRAGLQQLIESETHNFGWGYLPGSTGGDAEKAFSEFTQQVAAFLE